MLTASELNHITILQSRVHKSRFNHCSWHFRNAIFRLSKPIVSMVVAFSQRFVTIHLSMQVVSWTAWIEKLRISYTPLIANKKWFDFKNWPFDGQQKAKKFKQLFLAYKLRLHRLHCAIGRMLPSRHAWRPSHVLNYRIGRRDRFEVQNL